MAVVRNLLASGSSGGNQASFNVTVSGSTGRKLIFCGTGESLSGGVPSISFLQFNSGPLFTLAAETFNPVVPSNSANIWYYDVPDVLAPGSYLVQATWTGAQENCHSVIEVTGLVVGGPDATGTTLITSSTTVSASATPTVVESYGVSCVGGGNNQAVSTITAGTEYVEVQSTPSGAVLGASDVNTFTGTSLKTMGWSTSPAMNRFASAITLWDIIPDQTNNDEAAGMMAANM